MLEKPDRGKHISSLQTLINYGRKKYYNILARCKKENLIPEDFYAAELLCLAENDKIVSIDFSRQNLSTARLVKSFFGSRIGERTLDLFVFSYIFSHVYR